MSLLELSEMWDAAMQAECDPYDMLVMDCPDGGLLFSPLCKVATLMPDYGERWRVVLADGSVARRPGPLPAGPWVGCGNGFANPAYLVREGDQMRDPAGFVYARQDLPQTTIPPPDEFFQVLYLRGEDNAAYWVTDGGVVAAGTSAKECAAQHPHLVPAGRGTYVNRRRLRRIAPERKRFRLYLDEGTQLTVSWGAREALCRGLGLPHLYHLDPDEGALRDEGLRDWPRELARAPREYLREWFRGKRRLLIANQIWQTYRYRSAGLDVDYGGDQRSYWYLTMAPTLNRAGLLSERDMRWRIGTASRGRAPESYKLYEELLGLLIGQHALFCYADFGFEDPRPDLRRIGELRPEVLLLVEKTGMEKAVDLVAAKHGVSTLTLGGLPSLLSTEFFAKDLSRVSGSVEKLVAYVDFDPGGWIAASSFAKQLRRFGVECCEPVYLITPKRFTAEEIELYSQAIEAHDPQTAGKVEAWLEKSGGIDGKPMRMHANHLRPPERVLAAFEQLTGLKPNR